MDSPMLKMLKSQNPEVKYPQNMGQKWTDKEEEELLQQIKENMDIENISVIHKRTVGGITSRLGEIAYKMYLKKSNIHNIIEKTKLDENYIRQIIDKKENYNPKKIIKNDVNDVNKNDTKEKIIIINGKGNEKKEILIKLNGNDNNQSEYSIENEIFEIKKDIKFIKSSINELVEMMKSIYEFEESRKESTK
jgi:hypothetical protein